ncbi:two-component system, OmpR family, sensor histidine kinase BaeS [Pseudoalteromonas citrea]|uniref:histidine kinase n=2 Tax=Pseudoalteromonas citrea TaxID=43655 RepID=A0AAD4ALY8_9GAMM|nr:ATP-binding protein [Pseudoalteromonas citrea]KAF7775157.1 two-component system, OmpR family, sensor histidine kinase BaeS [Pseudoalteromonas citrea]
MKVTIRVKLLLMILIANSALVLAIYIANQIAFEKSFAQYVQSNAREKMHTVIVKVVETYKARNGFSWVKHRSPELSEIIQLYHQVNGVESNKPARRKGRPPEYKKGKDYRPKRGPKQEFDGSEQRRPAKGGPRGDRKLPPKRGAKSLPNRLIFKSPDGQLLIGKATMAQAALWLPMYTGDDSVKTRGQGDLIGFIGIENGTLVTSRFDAMFAKQQEQQFLHIALIALLVTVILAIPFSKYLVQPIIRLRRTAKRLAGGDYEHKVKLDRRDELGLLARDMNKLADTLAQNQTARQQWIADISHELRTPIAVIRAELEGMIDGVIDTDEAQLSSLYEEIERLTNLVDDLHQLSLSDRGALTYNMMPCELSGVLNRCIDKRRSELSLFEVTVNCADKLTLHCDPQRISQLFDNLLQNTMRYTDVSEEKNGQLSISVTQTSEKTQVIWQDSSPSVTSEQLPMLFDRLYRVDNARTRQTGGSGLGLAICTSIVEGHQGTIRADLSDLGGLAIIMEFTH